MNLNFEKSRPIVIVPYSEGWENEFIEIGTALRRVLGASVLRIDHIGSTSVPQLAAKDVIDIQITVSNLHAADFTQKLKVAGYEAKNGLMFDNLVGLTENDANNPNLQKLFYREKASMRRTHIHIREMGRINQSYPLLFRDYLRSSTTTRKAYEILKIRLSKVFPESIEGYLYIKDPLMDLIFEAAQRWAKLTCWKADEAFL